MIETVYGVFLDWDVRYYHWRKHTLGADAWKRRSEKWLKQRTLDSIESGLLSEFRFGEVRASYRRSAGVRVHVWLQFAVPGVEHFIARTAADLDAFALRARCGDDRVRLMADLERVAVRSPVNRLFDTKYKNGKARRAGEWVPWYVQRFPR